MTIKFQGQTFAQLREFREAFPIYKSYVEIIRGGADTVEKLESALYVKNKAARAGSLAGARSQAPYTVKVKRPGSRKPMPKGND